MIFYSDCIRNGKSLKRISDYSFPINEVLHKDQKFSYLYVTKVVFTLIYFKNEISSFFIKINSNGFSISIFTIFKKKQTKIENNDLKRAVNIAEYFLNIEISKFLFAKEFKLNAENTLNHFQKLKIIFSDDKGIKNKFNDNVKTLIKNFSFVQNVVIKF